MESFIETPGKELVGRGDASTGEVAPTREAGRDDAFDRGQVGEANARALRVLVVDDNAHSAESLALIINMWGHDTRIAYGGAEAVDSAREYRPDVILLDIGLPGMNGYTVVRTLRRDPRLRNATFLAMTGYGREEDLREALEAGFDRHLLKPLELDALEELLARIDVTRP